MAFDPTTLAAGSPVVVLDSKDNRYNGAVLKIEKRAQRATVKLDNGKTVTVGFDRLRGKAGRPPKAADTPAPTAPKPTAPAPKPAAAAAAKPAAKAPAAAPKADYFQLIERLADYQNQIATLQNAVSDTITELGKYSPDEIEAAPAPKGRAGTKPAPMSDEPSF